MARFLDQEVINLFNLKIWEIDYNEFEDIRGGGKAYHRCDICGKLRTNGKIGDLADCKCEEYLKLVEKNSVSGMLNAIKNS